MTTNREELAAIKFESSRFCLDKLEHEGEEQFQFVWRGTSKSPDGFVALPAIFTWKLMGQLMREAISTGKVPREAMLDLLGFQV